MKQFFQNIPLPFTNIWSFLTLFFVFGLFNLWALITLLIPISKKKRAKLFLLMAPLACRTIVYLSFISRAKLIDRRDPISIKEFNKKGILFIANHSSMIDIPLMNTTHPITTLMKREVIYIPVMTLPSLAASQITVKRGDPIDRKRALKESLNRLYNNEYLQYYPEGTRSKTGSPKPYEQIHLAILRAAYKKDIPIVPISLFGTKELLTSYGMIKPFHKMGMITHDFILPKNFENEEDFLKASWEKVESGFKELREILS